MARKKEKRESEWEINEKIGVALFYTHTSTHQRLDTEKVHHRVQKASQRVQSN